MYAHKTTWQAALANAVTDPLELLRYLKLDPLLLPEAYAAAKLFPLKVTHSFLARIRLNDIHDPLLRQILPLGCELENTAGYCSDPLEETRFNPRRGLLHKYQGRVLLTLVGACAIHCRYCFRREFPYASNNPGRAGWQHVFDYLAKDPTIHEVILSGGDPLVANDVLLQEITDGLLSIPHFKRLRIHSRIPIVLPERITPDFLTWLTTFPLKKILVIHCNHPQELNQEVREVLRQLTNTGTLLLNQTVLLKGVNDAADTLIALSETLFDMGVQPYYLHILDKVQGTAHFDMDNKRAIELHAKMAAHLPGYLVPKLVCEQPGASGKLSLSPWELCTD